MLGLFVKSNNWYQKLQSGEEDPNKVSYRRGDHKEPKYGMVDLTINVKSTSETW